jgi:hypothetical protein
VRLEIHSVEFLALPSSTLPFTALKFWCFK